MQHQLGNTHDIYWVTYKKAKTLVKGAHLLSWYACFLFLAASVMSCSEVKLRFLISVLLPLSLYSSLTSLKNLDIDFEFWTAEFTDTSNSSFLLCSGDTAARFGFESLRSIASSEFVEIKLSTSAKHFWSSMTCKEIGLMLLEYEGSVDSTGVFSFNKLFSRFLNSGVTSKLTTLVPFSESVGTLDVVSFELFT